MTAAGRRHEPPAPRRWGDRLGRPVFSAPRRTRPASSIDAAKVEGRIDQRLYGQFLEFMYEGIKGGLYAELLRDRGFEEAPNTSAVPPLGAHPDDRIDDYGLSFGWDERRLSRLARLLRREARPAPASGRR